MIASPEVQATVAWIVTTIVALGLMWVFYPAFQAASHHDIQYHQTVLSSSNHTNNKTDSITPTKPLLSLVIPAYNEQHRIPIMLQAATQYLQSHKAKQTLHKLQQCAKALGYDQTVSSSSSPSSIEWIIVNDGSKDQTNSVVQNEQSLLPSNKNNNNSNNSNNNNNNNNNNNDTNNSTCTLVNLRQNSGKGAAVKVGMNVARGYFRLMVDADGATDFGPGLEQLVHTLSEAVLQGTSPAAANDKASNNKWAVFGSRAHLAGAERTFLRTLLMHAFHFFVSMLISSKIQDTQCGFKLFTQDAAIPCFSKLHLRRWAFDTEIVILASYQQTRILEVGVPWQEIDGSKLHTSKLALAIVSITMLRDMLCVRLCYSLRIWNATSTSTGSNNHDNSKNNSNKNDNKKKVA